MPRSAKLKVYRTPIGFHDAYVAAPSQKAAMEIWGTGKDLFARGEAELVTDAALTAEPLAPPGTVVKRLRATAAEQIAALPPDKRRPPSPPATRKAASRPLPMPAPRPSREDLDAAERELDAARARQADELKVLAKREAELARERRALDNAQVEELARLTRRRNAAAAAYEDAIGRWRG